ncbi:hypothetical protein KAJ83_12455 [Marivibrio halodurans]|uniref:Invasion protein IalB, involved in pathogenesis n=1 Tax=Marivibrio halodurans TaxID=2039722 RepID=A0A8J7SN65_9PROT|nr:hypothetical protein [Marivibrio halodurans]MBP5857823.1 hypothetical protein [Marivibrio halodurans]
MRRARMGGVLRALPVAGALVTGAVHAEADACRERFVACVEETGNPMSCHAVSAACATEGIPKTTDLRDLHQTLEMEQHDGQAYARLTIENRGGGAVKIAAIVRDMVCPDTERDRLYFVFEREIQPGEQLRSAPIVACYGQGAARPLEDTGPGPMEGGYSARTATIHCDLAGDEPVTVGIRDNGLIDYRRADGRFGVYRAERPDGAGLFETACVGWEMKPPDDIQALRRDAMRTLDGLLDRMGHAGAETASGGKTTATGPRN